jgi:curved DNA-binding protein CbpA
MADPDKPDHYAVLELPTDADEAAVHEAYRRKAQQYHPDKVQHLGAEFRALAERRMRQINVAYATLRDPRRRRAYDAERLTPKEQHAGSRPAATGKTPSGQVRARMALLLVALLASAMAIGVWTVARRGSRDLAHDLRQARAAFAKSNWEEAIPLLHRATAAQPGNLEAWNLRWQAEMALGLYRDAAESLDRAIALNPADPALRIENARARFVLGDMEQVHAELLWLDSNGQTDAVLELLDEFRERDPARAEAFAQDLP